MKKKIYIYIYKRDNSAQESVPSRKPKLCML